MGRLPLKMSFHMRLGLVGIFPLKIDNVSYNLHQILKPVCRIGRDGFLLAHVLFSINSGCEGWGGGGCLN